MAVLAAAIVLLSSGSVTPDEQTAILAAQVGLDPLALQGALNATGVSPQAYLIYEGLLDPPVTQALPGHAQSDDGPSRPPSASAPPTTPTSGVNPRVACIIAHESRGVATAVNPRSGAAGLGQFLASTWRTTPQGRAGLSVFDPAANREAVAWMVSVGRAREFVAVSSGGC